MGRVALAARGSVGVDGLRHGRAARAVDAAAGRMGRMGMDAGR
jgi:hypothetical protein